MHVKDLIIIGAGPGGVTAAIYAKRAGLDFEIFEKMCIGGAVVNAYEIENYPGVGKIVGSDLAMNFMNDLNNLEINVQYDEIVEIHKEEDCFKVVGKYSGEYFAKKVLLALGTKPKQLGLPNEDALVGKGISYCATCDGSFYKDKDVLVVGGGNSALSEATYLTNICKKVYLITRHELKGDKKEIEKFKSKSNIEIIEFKSIKEIIASPKVEKVILTDTNTKELSEIKVDGIFVYVGQNPQTQIVKDLGVLNERGFIEVDNHFETKVKGLFAIGDCIVKDLRQIVTAVGDAGLAIHYIED